MQIQCTSVAVSLSLRYLTLDNVSTAMSNVEKAVENSPSNAGTKLIRRCEWQTFKSIHRRFMQS